MLLPDERKEVLISLCNTRWVERYDALLRVVELFKSLIYSLNSISKGSNIMMAQQSRHPTFSTPRIQVFIWHINDGGCFKKNFEFVAFSPTEEDRFNKGK